MNGSPDIASRLAAWRKKRQITQRQAAEHLGISERTLQQWEQGRQSPRGLALRTLLSEIGN